MKSQLLEDIGENTTSSPAPAGRPGQPKAGRAAPGAAAGAPPAAGTAQPGEGAPDELNKVFEEIAALEAQFVPPGQQHDPGMAAAESGRPLAGAVDGMVPPPGEAGPPDGLLAEPPARAATPQEPLFDFTPPAPPVSPAPTPQTADPFTPTWPQRSRRGYLPWVAGMLACALLFLGGRWLYQERNVAGTLALVAAGAKDKGGVVRTEPAPALSTKEAEPASRPAPAPPPMVLLEPANAARAGDAPAAADQADQADQVDQVDQADQTEPPKAASVARRAAEPVPAKPSRQVARSRSDGESRPARPRHEPVRPLASASPIRKTETPARDTSLAATLKACRELGYHATECVKRGCGITQYGLVCRGR